MSMWNLATGEFDQFKKNGYKRWPNPFRNAVKEVRQLACEDTWQAKITMYGIGFGAWAWSAFVPQPTEIIRKTATGSYKCGFYFGMEFDSPLNLVFEEDAVTAFAEMVRPVTTGLFYIWATETLFSALDTWQSLVYAQEMCDLENNETLLAEGSGEMFGNSGVGSPGFYDVLYDPLPRYTWPGGDIESHATKHVQLDALGHILAGGAAVDDIMVYFARGSTLPMPGSTIFHTGAMAPGAVAGFSISYSGVQAPGTFQIVVAYQQHHTGLQRSHIIVQRWTGTFHDVQRPPCRTWRPQTLIT